MGEAFLPVCGIGVCASFHEIPYMGNRKVSSAGGGFWAAKAFWVFFGDGKIARKKVKLCTWAFGAIWIPPMAQIRPIAEL